MSQQTVNSRPTPAIRQKIRRTPSEIVFSTLSYIIIGLFALACFIPFYLIIIGSFTEEKYIITKGYSFFLNASNFSVGGYQTVFQAPEKILSAYGITSFVTLIGTVLSILITTMTGYALSRQSFPWRDQFSFFYFFTTLFSGGLVPWYLLCTKYLAFTNHIHSLIVPGLFSVWNMIISKSFMKGIPNELIESAKVDGASEYRIYFQLMLPLSKPLIATLSLFTALGYWNDWYNCMLFITDSKLFNLQFTLQNILSSVEALTDIANKTGVRVASLPAESMKMAMCIVALGPIILLYPFLQKYFVKGMTIGAVKG